ncbi:SoxR reducing system RseC family protein [Thiocystis violacea]|uniref:SoxR reducing system RseC family protein n=1 Tax=Thiocystis violacea TaxID=13725 RepID=UPI001906CDFB|nr:SoxR reducing system RseC family protein [Thiocystis violacea]MBK1719905.1 Fis family transcriptional regulator [Thiocystis violacea]
MERVIEETVTVVAVADGHAWVEANRRSACGHCGRAESCGTGTLAKLFRHGPHRLRIADPVGLREGERVTIGISADTLIRASLTAYLLPLATLVAAAGLGTAWGLPEGAVALFGIAGLGAGLWLGGALTGGVAGRDLYRPTLARRTTQARLVQLDPTAAARTLDSSPGITPSLISRHEP